MLRSPMLVDSGCSLVAIDEVFAHKLCRADVDKRNKTIKELRHRYIADREANGDHEAVRALGEEQLYSVTKEEALKIAKEAAVAAGGGEGSALAAERKVRKLIEAEATLNSLISQGEDLKDEVAQAVQGQDVAAAAPLQDLQRNTQTAEGAAAEVALVQDLRTSGAAGMEMELKHEERARQAGFAAIQEGLTLKEVQETVRQALHSEGSSLPDQESSAAIIAELTGAATW